MYYSSNDQLAYKYIHRKDSECAQDNIYFATMFEMNKNCLYEKKMHEDQISKERLKLKASIKNTVNNIIQTMIMILMLTSWGWVGPSSAKATVWSK